MLGPTVAQIFLTLIGDQTLFIQKSAHEILWGYNDPLLEFLVIMGLAESSIVSIQVGWYNHSYSPVIADNVLFHPAKYN